MNRMTVNVYSNYTLNIVVRCVLGAEKCKTILIIISMTCQGIFNIGIGSGEEVYNILDKFFLLYCTPIMVYYTGLGYI